jgi:hypothetical protein
MIVYAFGLSLSKAITSTKLLGVSPDYLELELTVVFEYCEPKETYSRI